MAFSMKRFKEETIGVCYAMCDAADKENRDFTSEEQVRFDALLESYKAATGRQPPREKNAFRDYARAPDRDATPLDTWPFDNPMAGPGPRRFGPQGAFPASNGHADDSNALVLVDEHGEKHRAVGPTESFSEAVLDNPSRFGTSRDDSAQLVSDGLTAGGIMRAMITGPRTDAEFAALGGSGGPSGGYDVPMTLSAGIIDKLRANLVINEAGAMTIPIDSDHVRFVKLASDPSATWRRENTTISESEPTFSAFQMFPKSLAVIIKISRELLEDSRNVESALERSLAESFAREVDRVCMLGEGDVEPLGLINEENIGEVASVGTPSDYLEILDGYKTLLDANSPDPTAVIMSNREWRAYAGLSDSTGQPLRRPQALDGLQFLKTSAVPTTLGGGSDSVMFMGDFSSYLIGMRSNIRIEVLKELFAEKHQYGFVAHLRMDTGVVHPGSFCKLTGVTA